MVNGVFFITHIKILPKGIYFATIKEKDGPNDKASELNRANVYRLSTCVSKTYLRKTFWKETCKDKMLGPDILSCFYFLKKYLSSNRCFIPYLIELVFERKYNLTQVISQMSGSG
jgi:hypothetical protein